jgi:hypothetical protein
MTSWTITFCRMAAVLCLAGLPAGIAPAAGEETPELSGALERHYTTNALESDQRVADWYTLLRGALRHELGDADANVVLAAEFQATRHDTVSIEDDRAVALSLTAFRRLDQGLELKGTLGYRAASEGDDLRTDTLTLGTRTLKQVVTGQVQLGADLGNATTLILELSDGLERIGATRFQHGLLPPTRLNPHSNRVQFVARLTRNLGPLSLGASASALLASVERLGTPPVGLSSEQYGLRTEATYASANGVTIGAAAGAELLKAANGLYSRVRPAWQLTFAAPLPRDMELRGTYFGRYESTDSDDPLASWLHRAEIEAGWKPRNDLALAAGMFCEVKENLLFENEERSQGFYAEATYQFTPSASLVLRIDSNRTYKTVLEVRETTVDSFIGVRAKL